jgi:hypothetical protein
MNAWQNVQSVELRQAADLGCDVVVDLEEPQIQLCQVVKLLQETEN